MVDLASIASHRIASSSHESVPSALLPSAVRPAAAIGWYGGFVQPLQQGGTGKPEWRSTREEIPLSELGGRLGEGPGMLMSISAMEVGMIGRD